MGSPDGLQGATGFLKKEHHVAAYGEGAVLTVGALVEVAITNVADRRMIGVTSSPAAVATGTLRDNVATELGESQRVASLPGHTL
jgi:hypothetical protein